MIERGFRRVVTPHAVARRDDSSRTETELASEMPYSDQGKTESVNRPLWMIEFNVVSVQRDYGCLRRAEINGG
jgi:hypothetical protein